MKRYHLLKKAFVFGLAFVLFAAAGRAEEPLYGYTASEEQDFVIDLMDAPKETGALLFSYYPGVRVELLSTLEEGWLHVRVCNIDGFMKAEQVSFKPDYMEAAHQLPIWILKGKNSNSGTVNYRELPSLNSHMLGYFYVEDYIEVYVMGISDEWYHTIIDGRMGFIKPDYLKDIEKTDTYVIGSVQSPVREGYK